jgi:hypothetical protein
MPSLLWVCLFVDEYDSCVVYREMRAVSMHGAVYIHAV